MFIINNAFHLIDIGFVFLILSELYNEYCLIDKLFDLCLFWNFSRFELNYYTRIDFKMSLYSNCFKSASFGFWKKFDGWNDCQRIISCMDFFFIFMIIKYALEYGILSCFCYRQVNGVDSYCHQQCRWKKDIIALCDFMINKRFMYMIVNRWTGWK